jgi:hypothetical protein
MSDPKFNIELVQLEDIIITNARIENNTDLVALEKNKYFFEIEYSFNLGVNESEKRIRVVFTCSIKTFQKADNAAVEINAKFDIGFIFKIDNFSDLVGESPDFAVNSDLVISLSNIAYSTSRGVIFTRCQGTILKSLILLIQPSDKLIDWDSFPQRTIN